MPSPRPYAAFAAGAPAARRLEGRVEQVVVGVVVQIERRGEVELVVVLGGVAHERHVEEAQLGRGAVLGRDLGADGGGGATSMGMWLSDCAGVSAGELHARAWAAVEFCDGVRGGSIHVCI